MTIIQADYEKLEEAAQVFEASGDGIAETYAEVKRVYDQLRDGGWVGEGSDAFFAEMGGEVLPAVLRLVSGLHEASGVARRISMTFQGAEEEAAALFKQEGTPPVVGKLGSDPLTKKGIGAGGTKTIPPPRIVIINGISSMGNFDAEGNPAHADDQTVAMEKLLLNHGYDPNEILATSAIFIAPLDGNMGGTNLQGTNLGGWLSPVDWYTQDKANEINTLTGGLAEGVNSSAPIVNPAWGSTEVAVEYIAGEHGHHTTIVYEQIKQNIDENDLLPGQSVVIMAHSGGGAVAANLAGMVERELGYDVSGVVTMGSPVGNFDEAARYAEQIVEVRHVNDRVGLPIVRSEESRWGIPISLGSGPIPGLSPFPTFINTEVWGRLINNPANVTSVTLTTPVPDGTSGAHGSYMSHPAASAELMRELQRLFPELSLDVK